MSPTRHAKLAPSAASRWMQCPGSLAASAGWPDESSPAAAEGTFAHEIASRCLETQTPALGLVGESDGVHKNDEDMAAHLQVYLDVVKKLEGDNGRLWVETKVSLKGLRDDIKGTADAIVFDDGVLHVIDLKYGAGHYVEVEDNPQLMIYALGAVLSMPQQEESIDWVSVHIVQPRHYKGPAHRSADYSVNDLYKWGIDVVEKAAVATEQEGAALHAGDHCLFCPAKPGCTELRDTSLARTQHLFENGSETPKADAPAVDMMSPVDIAAALSSFATIETWIKAVREHAYKQADKGVAIPGYKLVDQTKNRQWTDLPTAELVLGAYLPEGKSMFGKSKLVSPAAAEKLLPKETRAIVSTLAHKPKCGTVLVPSSDSKPAHNAGAVFDAIPEV